MKTNIYTGLAFAAVCILLFSACALGFEPAWKSKPTSIAFQLISPELPESSSYARAIAQGGGYLYLRTIGGPTGNGSFYGPYQVGANTLFETTDIPPGTYTGIGVLFSPAPLETKTGAYGGVLTPFATLMNLPDTEFNAFTSNGDTSAFNAMLDGDASGFMLKDVTLNQGTVNTFKLTLEPMTGPASTVDASVLPTIALTSPAPASLVRKFIKVKNIGVMPGYTITALVATVSATGSPKLGTAALYDGQGKLLQSFPVPAPNPLTADQVYSVPYTSGDYFNFYIEYKAASLDVAFSKVEEAVSYTVNFDSQGATTPPAPVVKTVTYPATTVVTMPTAPLRTGYTFNGWFTAPNGGGSPFAGATAVTADITVYASWTANSFQVIFDPNTGTGSMAPLPINEGNAASLTPNAFTKPGYTFNGWGIAAGGPVTYLDGASYTMGASSVTLYAQWTANSYLVSFDAQGGTTSQTSYSATYGSGYITHMPATLPGFTFGGWWTAPMGGGIEVIGGTNVTTPSDHTLFAKWTINQYSVTYDPNMASSGMIPVAQTADYNTPVIVSANIGSLVGPLIQDGIRRRFIGWNTDPAGAGIAYLPAAPLILGAANVILYAQYQDPGVILRQIGPSDGLVFYDQGSIINGWRYLEASMIDQAIANTQSWSNVTGVLGANLTAVGEGITNTAAIIAQAGHTTSAALLCDNYVTITSDWYLPSKDELNAMYTNLHLQSLGNFAPEYYWASTESGTLTYAWRQHFNTGAQTETIKTDTVSRVRAIRRF